MKQQTWQRTLKCGELRTQHVGQKVILNGWVARLRNLGSLIFISLRDRYGLCQITIRQEDSPHLFQQALHFKMEYCLSINGVVALRKEEDINQELPTGEIEILPNEILVLNTCITLPFMINEESKTSETNRLHYRYLTLRNSDFQSRLILRSKVSILIRNYLQEKEFIEVETPTLVKSTPEGARDFLVPSRLHKNCVFALAQSPQLFKQLLMMGGIDRYYQLARCYRDEDPRGDRQAEFTQLDLEMSFVRQQDVIQLIEGLIAYLFEECLKIKLELPFPRISYKQALENYGSDKPDMRFSLLLQNVTHLKKYSEMDALKASPILSALVYKGEITRKQLTHLEEKVKEVGLQSLGYFKVKAEDKIETGLAKYLTKPNLWLKELGAQAGDTVLLGFGNKEELILNAMGQVRLELAKIFNLINPSGFNFVWVDSFPLFERDENDLEWLAKHHLFTRPQEQFISTLEEAPEKVLGELYDLVCNGWELGSGSIRVHESDLQQRLLDIVGFSREKAKERFGYFIEAMKYGAPPHGGIALGFDRLLALMSGQSNIRDVLAFPRNTAMYSPLDGSPSPVEESAIQEAGFKWLP